MKHRLRRSELSTPATNEKMIAKAAASDAALAFLDLEDSVAPAAKTGARANVVRGLTGLDWGTTTRAYRINGVHTPWCLDDLVEVVGGAGAGVEVVIVPKVKAPRDVWFVDDLLTQLERRHGLTASGQDRSATRAARASRRSSKRLAAASSVSRNSAISVRAFSASGSRPSRSQTFHCRSTGTSTWSRCCRRS